MIHYFCKYTPIEIFKGFDEDVTFYNPTFENLDLADKFIHRNVCSFSRALINGRTKDSSGTLLFTDCCDSIRRAMDVLSSLGQDTVMIFLPRKQDCCGIELYKNELLRLIKTLEKKYNKTFDLNKFRSAFCHEERPIGPYIAIMGARIGDNLMEEIKNISPFPVVNNTCTGLRRLGLPPDTDDIEELIGWYSKELLTQPACMRMTDIASRRILVEDPNIKGIIYNTVNFCDYYGFEYVKLKSSTSIPMLKIETDFTTQGTGQILTRLQAFFEELDIRSSSHKPVYIKEDGYFAGIDSGSTSTNAVILDSNKNIVSFFSVPTGAKVAISASQALDGALKKAGIDRSQIIRTVTTGYGRNAIEFKDRDVTEITCHGKGAYFLNSNVRTVIDIGGQDSKIIRLNDKGEIQDFIMNDKCAAGTGRFIELMATSLGIGIEEMARRGLNPKEDIVISSMCSVFAQSEVVSLVAIGKETDDIICGLNRSVAAKVTALAGRKGMEKEIMMTGGVARNMGVVAAIEERVGSKIIVPDEPDICGALGAALIAMGN